MVAWKKVCKPKEEGGLRLLNLCLFNKALLLGQIWDLVRKKDLLWIRWMNSYFLKDQTIWKCVVKSHHSWVRKKILSLREDAQKCIELLDNPVPTWRFSSNMFSTRSAYDLISGREAHINWDDIIWNALAHPKHSFCAWLAILDRLPTKVRLRELGEGERSCCWCNETVENGNHLFFQCSASAPIYSYLRLIGISAQWDSWEELVEWKNMKRWSCGAQKILAFFIITAATYLVWRARNQLIFKGESSNEEIIKSHIWKMLKFKVQLISHSKAGSKIADWFNVVNPEAGV
ncbi:hypothetical protein QQ045_011903 [Rhodiola kirilowii]